MSENKLDRFRKLKHIINIDEMMNEYAVDLKNYNKKLRVKIFKDKNGRYYHCMNYKIATKSQSTYVSNEGNHETVEAALFEAIEISMHSYNL